jgi:hypothetical protein
MAALTGQTIADSYDQLLHVDRDGGNGANLVNVKDGKNDTTFALQLATTSAGVIGALANPGFIIKSTTASGTGTGAGLQLITDDNSAMAANDRLGLIEFLGAEASGGSSNIVGASIQAICSDGWSASENGTDLKFFTTDADNSHTEVLCMYSDNHLLIPRIGSTSFSGRLYFYSTTGSEDQYLYGDANSMVSIAQNSNYIHAQNENVIWDGSQWYPNTDDAKNLGTGSYRWNDIYATNNTIQTSDEDLKENIADSSLGLSFINKLKPKSYKWKNTPEQKYGDNEPTGDDNKKAGDVKQAEVVHTRKHYGLIAQDVKATLDELSVATKDFAGYIDPSANGGSGKLGLRYSEFIAPMIKAIQELSAKVTALENG